jgi:hypothetical protein
MKEKKADVTCEKCEKKMNRDKVEKYLEEEKTLLKIYHNCLYFYFF